MRRLAPLYRFGDVNRLTLKAADHGKEIGFDIPDSCKRAQLGKDSPIRSLNSQFRARVRFYDRR
jgi:hypothetical protein